MLGWGCRSVVEHLPSMLKMLGLTLSTEKAEEHTHTQKTHLVHFYPW